MEVTHSFTEQLQSIANRYLEEHEGKPTSKRDMAAWAINHNLSKPQPADMVSQCADQLAQPMREENIVDPQGRSVRAKHVTRIKDDEGEQTFLWADIRMAPPEHMTIALKQRRQHIVGECHQLKLDVDSYNENRRPSTQIPMTFDFTMDLLELDAADKAA